MLINTELANQRGLAKTLLLLVMSVGLPVLVMYAFYGLCAVVGEAL